MKVRIPISSHTWSAYCRVTIWLEDNFNLVAVFVVVAFLFWAMAVLLGYLPPHSNWTTD